MDWGKINAPGTEIDPAEYVVMQAIANVYAAPPSSSAFENLQLAARAAIKAYEQFKESAQ